MYSHGWTKDHGEWDIVKSSSIMPIWYNINCEIGRHSTINLDFISMHFFPLSRSCSLRVGGLQPGPGVPAVSARRRLRGEHGLGKWGYTYNQSPMRVWWQVMAKKTHLSAETGSTVAGQMHSQVKCTFFGLHGTLLSEVKFTLRSNALLSSNALFQY